MGPINNIITRVRNFTFHILNQLESRLLYYLVKLFGIHSGANITDIKKMKRNKDIAFIMGSGYSINNISEREWSHIKNNGDVIAFNNFFRGRFIPITFNIIREMGNFSTILTSNRIFRNYCETMLNNPFYNDTKFFVKFDKDSRDIVWSVFFLKYLKNKKVCFFKNNRISIGLPSENIDTIRHFGSTLFDSINISYIMGYKKIVLVGIDLYDRRYFWLNEDETRDTDKKRGSSHSDLHSTSDRVPKAIDVWKEYLGERGVKLFIYNPRSLLKDILPLYKIS